MIHQAISFGLILDEGRETINDDGVSKKEFQSIQKPPKKDYEMAFIAPSSLNSFGQRIEPPLSRI
jgi:hypothetical protein